MSLHICQNPQNVHTTPKVNPNVNYELWVIMIYQYGITDRNTRITLVGDVDSGEGYKCVGAEDIYEYSVLSTQFCCEPKTALKNKVY